LPNTEHRKQLLDNFLLFNKELKAILKSPFFQWIDGSFVTNKELPNDLDVVTFVDYEVLQHFEYEMIWMKAKAKIDWNIDNNTSHFCSSNHFQFEKYLKTREMWQRLYGTTRSNDQDIKYPKGFIQINHI
jgi:hypothetical protein